MGLLDRLAAVDRRLGIDLESEGRGPSTARLVDDPALAWRTGLRRDGYFRFDDAGRIVGRWDVLQVIPQTSAKDNGMF